MQRGGDEREKEREREKEKSEFEVKENNFEKHVEGGEEGKSMAHVVLFPRAMPTGLLEPSRREKNVYEATSARAHDRCHRALMTVSRVSDAGLFFFFQFLKKFHIENNKKKNLKKSELYLYI